MKKITIFAVCVIFTGLLTFASAVAVYAIESQVVQELIIDADDFSGLNAALVRTPLYIRIHQEEYVLVTFEVIEEFERGSRPEFNFCDETGVLHILREPYENGVIFSGIAADGHVHLSIRNNENFNHNNRAIIIDGQLADNVDFAAISGVTFIDTGFVTVYVPGDFTLDKFSANLSRSPVRIFGENALVIKEVSADAARGSILLSGVTVDGNVEMNTYRVDITVADSQVSGSFFANAFRGGVSLYGSNFAGSLTVQGYRDSITWENITVEGGAFAETSRGSITLSGSHIAGHLTARTYRGIISLIRVDTDMDSAAIDADRGTVIVSQ